MKANVNLSRNAADILNEKLTAVESIAAMLVLQEAQRLCPVDTGDLKASLEIKESFYGTEIGSDLPYAAAVELGSRGRLGTYFLYRALKTVLNKFAKRKGQPPGNYLK